MTPQLSDRCDAPATIATDSARPPGRLHVPWRGWWEAVKRAIIADEKLSAKYSRTDDELRAKGL